MKKVLRSRVTACILILIMVCLGIVLAGDVIVKEGDLDVSGSAILGDATTDYHAINVNPDSNSMLTAEFLNTEDNSTHYFFKGKFTDSGDTEDEREKHSYGYYLDMDVSGLDENNGSATRAYGVYIDLDDTSVIDNDASHSIYGIWSAAYFGGTDIDCEGLQVYGGRFQAEGDLAGYGRHLGLYSKATGTADENYGIFAYTYGATNVNCGIYAYASGAAEDNYGIFAHASGGATNYAAYFVGDVHISGDLYSATESAPWSKAEQYGKTDVEILKALEQWDKENVPQEFYREVEVERIDETTGERYYITETQWNIWEIIKLNQGAILELKKENETLKGELAAIKKHVGME